MAYLPVASISRSQRIRLGRGLGNSVVGDVFNMGDLGVHPQSGELITLFYANLNDPNVRRDLQHHAALGALEVMGPVSTTVTSDLMAPSRPTVSAGTGLSVSSTAFQLVGRTFGGVITVPAAASLPVAANSSGATRVDALVVNSAGNLSVISGEANVSEVDSVATTGTPTGGTFTLSGTLNTIADTSVPFTTGAIAYNASAATIATAVQTALEALSDEDITVTGSGGALPTAVTLTTPGISLSGLSAASSVTGGTTPTVAFTQTTAGVYAPVVGGNVQVVATFPVTNGATSIGSVTAVIPTS